MKKFKELRTRAWTEMKIGWSLSQYPDHILLLEKNIFFRLFKIIAGGCLFLIVSGAAQQFNKMDFYIIFIFSFVYSLYRLLLVYYMLKQFIINVYTGKLISRN